MRIFKNALFTLPFFLFSTHALFGQDAGDQRPPDQGFSQTLVMIAVALIFFYFIMWRPEQKRRKAMEEMKAGLKKGDKVIVAGILGNIVRVQENTVIIRTFDGARLEVLKMAISDVTPGSEEDVKKAEKDDKKLVEISELQDKN